MILTLYILLEILAFSFMLLGYANPFKLEHSSRLFFLVIATIFFGFTGMSAFQIEEKPCMLATNQTAELTDMATNVTTTNYTNAYTCTTNTYQDLPLGVMNFMFMILSVLSLIILGFDFFNGGKQ